MLKTLTCIVCPNGCEITVRMEEERLSGVEGAACKRGEAYAVQEMTAPMRTISSSVRVEGGDMPLVSVRLNRPIPKSMIFAVMEEIRRAKVAAPVGMGDVMIANVLGTGSDVIATRHVARKNA